MSLLSNGDSCNEIASNSLQLALFSVKNKPN